MELLFEENIKDANSLGVINKQATRKAVKFMYHQYPYIFTTEQTVTTSNQSETATGAHKVTSKHQLT